MANIVISDLLRTEKLTTGLTSDTLSLCSILKFSARSPTEYQVHLALTINFEKPAVMR